MRAKKYFWNQKHHRELDLKMGLLKEMPEAFADLASACGMSPYTGGTMALKPFFLFAKKPQNIKNTIRADVNSEEYKRTFLMASVFSGVN